ncbi:MAG: F0F1 ATP synthase subunit delta [Caldimonas sp.]
MLIDWFTVGAQALNFAVLVWLMKRFLYKPVLDAIDAREARIAAELADADKKRAEADHDRDDFQHKNDAFDKERAALLKKAADEANGERDRLLDAARKAADDLAAKRAQSLAVDARNLSRSLSERTQREVFAIARKALGDLASASLDESTCDVLVRRLHALEAPERKRLGEAFESADEPLRVRSAFEMPAAQRSAMQKVIHETFATKAAVRFETAPELVGGIELSAGGHKLAWSIADYLTSLERGVGELLQSQAVPEPAAKAAAKAPAPTVSTVAVKPDSPADAEPAAS